MNNELILIPPFSIIRKLVFKIKFNWKTIWVLGFIAIIIFLFLYIIQINTLAEETYRIQDYQNKIATITQENDIIFVNSLKKSSLSNVETLIKDLGFEKTQKIQYIHVLDRQVVAR